MRNIEDHASETVQKILLGNKCDLADRKKVEQKRGEALAAEYGIKFFETSAKKNINVEEAFFTLAQDIKEQLIDIDPPTRSTDVHTLRKDAGGEGKKKCC